MSKKTMKQKRQELADARIKELAAKRKARGFLGDFKAGAPGTKEWKEDREEEGLLTGLEYSLDHDAIEKMKKDTGYKGDKKTKKSKKSEKPSSKKSKKVSKILKDLS